MIPFGSVAKLFFSIILSLGNKVKLQGTQCSEDGGCVHCCGEGTM
jgi:hypothetical protein